MPVNNSEKEKLTRLIKQNSAELGFFSCGISKAEFLSREAPIFEKWLNENRHGEMSYMENNFDKRLDPRKLVDGAKTVISFLFNYYPEKILNEKNNFIISKYAYGNDYHFFIKNKLKTLAGILKKQAGEINIRAFVDSAPVLERAWAVRSGLGCTGKNAFLISPRNGSFFFLAELITDLELIYDKPFGKNFCGKCTKCIDACPTCAIIAPGVIDSRKCISYLTIELKKNIPERFTGNMNHRIFGCDICQDVCPWNHFSKPHHEPLLNPHPELEKMNKNDWENLMPEKFRELFKKSAVKRTGYEGLMRNIHFVK